MLVQMMVMVMMVMMVMMVSMQRGSGQQPGLRNSEW